VQGVVAPRFNKAHLLVVEYDADATTAMALLGAVTGRGIAPNWLAFDRAVRRQLMPSSFT